MNYFYNNNNKYLIIKFILYFFYFIELCFFMEYDLKFVLNEQEYNIKIVFKKIYIKY